MERLPSGLADLVAEDEDLARFLTSERLYRSPNVVKPAAFLPSPADRETSVFRHGASPADDLWALGRAAAGARPLHGAGIVNARVIQDANLEVFASEPPARHAAIRGWPWIEDDPALSKARQKERAAVLAQHSRLVLP